MAEKKVIELEVNTNLGSLKSQLKQAQIEVQTLADKFGATSSQAVEAAKNAALLKDKIGDAKNLTDAFNPDAKFKALTGTLTGVAGGFSVVTGALGAFGKQNEGVEKALLKVQSAMALASGAQAIGESIDSFKQLGAVIKATSIFQGIYNFVQTGSIKATTEATVAKTADAQATVAQGTATVATSVATTGASVALKVLRAALISTGIGVLVVGLGMLISNLDTIMNFFTGAADKNKKFGEATKQSTIELNKQIIASDKASEALKTKNGHEVNMAKASGASAEEIRKLTLKHADEAIALDKASLATARNTYEKEKNTLANMVANGVSDELIEKQRELVKKARENVTDERKDLEKSYEEKKAVVRNNEEEIATEIFDKKQKIKENNKTINDKIKDENKIAAQTELDRIKQLNQDIKNLTEEQRVSKLTDEEKEKDALSKKYDKIIADGKKAKIDVSVLEEENRLGLAAITKKYDDADASLRLTKSQNIISEMVTEATKRLEGEKAISDKLIEIKKAEAEQKMALQQQGLDVALQGVQLIKGLFEKSKQVQKAAIIAESAIGIAKMIISNKIANAGALAAPSNILVPGSAAPVIALNNISTGIGIAANIAATAKALKTLGGGSAPSGSVGGGGGSATAPTISAPQFNVVGQSGINQLANLNQQPIQAYVVSGQVTSQQSLDRNRLENATLGG